MKILGIDYGTKRIGLALSDEAGGFAFPKSIVTPEAALEEILHILDAESVEQIVVGYSIASNSAENEIAEGAKKFIDYLSTKTHIPIALEREDFSTFEAHRYQTAAGHRDDSAAAIILQRFLDKRKK